MEGGKRLTLVLDMPHIYPTNIHHKKLSILVSDNSALMFLGNNVLR